MTSATLAVPSSYMILITVDHSGFPIVWCRRLEGKLKETIGADQEGCLVDGTPRSQ